MTFVFAIAWCFAAVLATAGIAKIVRPAPLATLLADFPHPFVSVRLLGLGEIAAGITAIAARPGGWFAAACLYAVLAGGSEYLLRNGTQGSCGCIGSDRSGLSAAHVAFCLAGSAACLGAGVVSLATGFASPLEVSNDVVVIGLVIAQIGTAVWMCARLYDEASSVWSAWNNPWWERRS